MLFRIVHAMTGWV